LIAEVIVKNSSVEMMEISFNVNVMLKNTNNRV
jgi:hypothetical protein